jgi:uncharacterized protein
MSSETLHAPRNRLTSQTLLHHHAIVSLKEELDAVDWYRQRAEDCEDAALKDILLHNMREEIEHACMVIEWLRRSVPEWASQLDAYLNTEAPITEVEEAETDTAVGRREVEGASGQDDTGRRAQPFLRLTIGSLKDETG